MSDPDPNCVDSEKSSINLQISRSFLKIFDEVWRAQGFDSRDEFIRYALASAVINPEEKGLWKDLAISEIEFAQGEGISSKEIKEKYGLIGE